MSGPVTHVWIEAPQTAGDQCVLSCAIERPGEAPRTLWFRVPREYASTLNPRADPFVLGILFPAMIVGCPVRVHGEVTASLLRNLEEFQSAWARMVPSQYRAVEIVADQEVNAPLPSAGDQAIFGFSGGVDSTFTLFRHSHRLAGRRSQRLGAGLLVHGFDIPLHEDEAFNTVCREALRQLRGEDVELIPMATNYREFPANWEHSFASALAACLHLFAGRYRAGLIGSSEPYERLLLPWGSSPVTDHLLSSDDFPIIHDGADFARVDKVAVIGNWEEARRRLRVCWVGPRFDMNCGVCEKCVRTILCFRVQGLGVPPCFAQDVTDDQILSLPPMSAGALAELELILVAAHERNITTSWVGAVETIVHRYRAAS